MATGISKIAKKAEKLISSLNDSRYSQITTMHWITAIIAIAIEMLLCVSFFSLIFAYSLLSLLSLLLYTLFVVFSIYFVVYYI